MGACQTQQNIDINLFITSGEIIGTKKKNISLEKKQIQKNSRNKSIKKAYMNNIEFNNIKKNNSNIYKLKLSKPKNKIPTRNKVTNISNNDRKTDNITRIVTNMLNHSFGGDKIPIDNIRSISRDKKKKLNISYNNEKIRENNSINFSKEKEINNILTERNHSKIIKDEDDTEKILSHLDEKRSNNKKNNLILSFDDFQNKNIMEEIKLYHLTEFNFNSCNKNSNENDFDDLLKSQNYKNKINFTNSILALPERKWYSELMQLSDKFKLLRQKKSLDDFFLIEYLNKIIKIYNHFNHLVWALAYYYSNSLFLKKSYWFKNDKINLPDFKSLEYVKGFEWKGLYIRVLTYDQAKKLIREIKALKIAFFDFLGLFNNNYSNNNLLSNELIFPLMSYAYIGGIVLYVSVEIKKFCYDSNYLNSNNKSLKRQSLRLSDKNEFNDCTIDNSDDNFSFDESILNEEININNYSKSDLNDTKIIKKLNENNLLKIFDEFSDDNKNDRKFKFILKNIYDIIPDLFNEDDNIIYKKLNIINCIDIKNEFKEPRFVNLTKINNLDSNNELNILSKLIRINATKENIEIYENKIDEINYKIIFNNNKKGIKINEQITKFFVQFPLIQNYELSRLLITEYLNVGNLNAILNKYYKENTLEIPDRNIIIYRTKINTKKKIALINLEEKNFDKKYDEFPKTNEDFISYVKQFSDELNLMSNKIMNVNNLFSFCDKFGFNKKFLPFCLEYIADQSIKNLIQIYLYVSFIKKFYNYKEGQILLMKLALFERNKDENIINSSDLIKSNNIIESQKKLFLDIIKLIFLPVEYLKEEDSINNNINTKEKFSKIFIENISFFIFLKMLKIKNYEKYIDFKSTLVQIETKEILQNFNEICRKNPFIFFDTLERMLNIRINSFIKYKSSIDINNIKEIKKNDIVIFTPEIKSFIDINAISGYIFTILLKNNQNLIEDKNNLLSKINIGFYFPKLYFKNPINYNNNNNKIKLNNNNYYIKNEEFLKTFCDMSEQILKGIISYNGDKEFNLSKVYIFLLLNYFFCNNLIEAKKFLVKIKNIINFQNWFSLNINTIIYLLDGILINEDLNENKSNFAKSFFLFLLNQGDIRNKNNKINSIIILPVLLLIYIININPNQYFNDYFKEILYILKNKFYNLKEIINKIESEIKNNKSIFIKDNNIKYFIFNSIIEYLYSKDNLIFNEDILSLFKIKLNKNITEYLLDEISYEKNAPNNIIIFFGKIFGDKNISKPRILYSLLDKKIKKIFSGYNSNFVIDIENKIYSWGVNTDGQLGIKYDINNMYINDDNPAEIIIKELEKDNNEIIKDIFCSEKYTLFLSNKSKVYCSNKLSEPKKINLFFEKEKIMQISIGENFCLFLTGWGNVYNISYIKDKLILENIYKIPNLNNIIKIFCGNKHCFAIAKHNIIFCWGSNSKGQLGLNENLTAEILIPKKLVLNIDNDSDIDNIFCGKDFSIFQNLKKEIFVCGTNEEGQLGINSNKEYYFTPILNEQFYNLEIIKISCGEKFCLAMIKDNITKIVNIWTWGQNKEGQLGLNSNIDISSPKLVPSLLEYVNHFPIDISCGNNHCLILLEKKGEDINYNINNDINKDNILNQLIYKYNKF